METDLNKKLDKILDITPKKLRQINRKLYNEDFMEDVFTSNINLYNINDSKNIKRYRKAVIDFAEYIFKSVTNTDNFVLHFSMDRYNINNICKHIYIDTDKEIELSYYDFYKHALYYLSGMKHDLDLNRFTIKREYFAEDGYLFGYKIKYNKESNNNGIFYKEPNVFIKNISKIFHHLLAGFYILMIILFFIVPLIIYYIGIK